MVVHSLPAGQPYSKLDKVLVSFFTQEDLKGEGKPLYVYESTRNGKTDAMTQAAPAYVFANGKYRNDNTKLGRLIADVMEADPARIQTPVLRTRMAMLKTTKEGGEKMHDALDEYVMEQNKALMFRLVKKEG